MNRRLVLRSGLVAAALVGLGGGAWILSLPSGMAAGAGPPIAKEETAAAIEALRPPKRSRPLIAIVGLNDSTETTDYLMSYGILRRSDVADVVALGTAPGAMTLFPALKVMPQATIAEFDAHYPDGADYVIVPAMSRDDDPAVLQWIRSQASRKAIVIGVCVGAKIVANAGLLDGKRATTHWYYLDELRDRHPAIRYVADRRLVVDQGVATTTGISASMPMMLTLIEAIAGRDKAQIVAQGLGLAGWDARHDSGAFKFTRPFALAAIANTLAFWNREEFGLEIGPGVDEVSLALVADAWSRTFRSRAVTYAAATGARKSRNGILIVPDRAGTDPPAGPSIPAIGELKPAQALDQALQEIEGRYGRRTANLVAMQLEYPSARIPPQ